MPSSQHQRSARRTNAIPPRAFTLIEVLVVVAIIALLLAILMPSLSRAREQARVAFCLSNLKQILTATSMYMTDNQDVVPIYATGNFPPQEAKDGKEYYRMGSTCMWGGRRGEIHFGTDPLGHDRPLTRYIYQRMALDDRVNLFRCPSDTAEALYTQSMKFGSIYETCGNSYYLNMHGELPTLKGASRVSPSRRVIYEEGNLMWRLGWYPKTLQPIWGWDEVNPPTDGPGWHLERNRFTIGFLDSHASYSLINVHELSGAAYDFRAFPRIWAWQ